MALTRITKGVIKPNENYDTHNIVSTGIVTAVGLDINGNADVSGNFSVGGVLTYEDVTSIDSVGIITAQKGIHVGAGVSAVGVGTFGGIKIGSATLGNNGTNLTIDGGLGINETIFHNGDAHTGIDFNSNDRIRFRTGGYERVAFESSAASFAGGVNVTQDLNVDGHTNLDNVSIAGVTTTTDDINLPNNKKAKFGSFGFQMYQNTSGSNNAIIEQTASGQFLRLKTNGGALSIEADSVNIRNSANSTQTAIFSAGGKTSLYYNSNLKLTTENTGVNITGIVTATSADINGDLDVDGHTNLDNVSIAGVSTNASTTYFDNQVYWRNGGSNKMFTLSNNAGMNWQDDVKAEFGNSGDLKIYHASNNSFINDTGTGALILDGSKIRLRLSGSTQLETDTNGITATGTAHRFQSGTSGDCELIIEADTDNNNELDNPRILFRQDGGNDWSAIGTNDNILEISNSVGSGAILFKTGSSNGYQNAVERFRISSTGKITHTYDGTAYDAQYGQFEIAKDGASNADPDWSYLSFHRAGQIGWQQGILSNDFVIASTGGASRNTLGAYRLCITDDGHVLFSGLSTKNDPRNAKGITIKSSSGGGGISFQNYGSNGSKNWRIRPDDMAGWGTLEFSVSPTTNSSTDWPDHADDIVMIMKPEKNVVIPNGTLGVGLNGTPSATFEVVDSTGGDYSHTKQGWARKRTFSVPIFNNQTRWYKVVNYQAGNMWVGRLEVYTARGGGFNQTKGYNEWRFSYGGHNNTIYGTGAENTSFQSGTANGVDVVIGGSPQNLYIKVPGSIYGGRAYFIFEGIYANWQWDEGTYLTSAP